MQVGLCSPSTPTAWDRGAKAKPARQGIGPDPGGGSWGSTSIPACLQPSSYPAAPDVNKCEGNLDTCDGGQYTSVPGGHHCLCYDGFLATLDVRTCVGEDPGQRGVGGSVRTYTAGFLRDGRDRDQAAPLSHTSKGEQVFQQCMAVCWWPFVS